MTQSKKKIKKPFARIKNDPIVLTPQELDQLSTILDGYGPYELSSLARLDKLKDGYVRSEFRSKLNAIAKKSGFGEVFHRSMKDDDFEKLSQSLLEDNDKPEVDIKNVIDPKPDFEIHKWRVEILNKELTISEKVLSKIINNSNHLPIGQYSIAKNRNIFIFAENIKSDSEFFNCKFVNLVCSISIANKKLYQVDLEPIFDHKNEEIKVKDQLKNYFNSVDQLLIDNGEDSLSWKLKSRARTLFNLIGNRCLHKNHIDFSYEDDFITLITKWPEVQIQNWFEYVTSFPLVPIELRSKEYKFPYYEGILDKDSEYIDLFKSLTNALFNLNKTKILRPSKASLFDNEDYISFLNDEHINKYCNLVGLDPEKYLSERKSSKDEEFQINNEIKEGKLDLKYFKSRLEEMKKNEINKIEEKSVFQLINQIYDYYVEANFEFLKLKEEYDIAIVKQPISLNGLKEKHKKLLQTNLKKNLLEKIIGELDKEINLLPLKDVMEKIGNDNFILSEDDLMKLVIADNEKRMMSNIPQSFLDAQKSNMQGHNPGEKWKTYLNSEEFKKKQKIEEIKPVIDEILNQKDKK